MKSLMNSVKAIAAGSIFIIVVILLMQLVFIFVAVAYNAIAKDYPFLNEITGSFRYLIGIPLFIITMFIGGFITASIAESQSLHRLLLHCIAVGLITAGGMMYSAMENTDLTLTGKIVFILAMIATSAGGLYWNKTRHKQSHPSINH